MLKVFDCFIVLTETLSKLFLRTSVIIPMNLTELLNIILIPLIISLAGTALFEVFRHRRKDIQITCRTLSIRHYKEKESGDVSISLSYKNENVGDSIVVATVMLVNTGRKDIAFSQVFEKEIGIVLKDAKIIDVIVERESEKVGSKVVKGQEKDGCDWLLSWGILKKRERIVLRIVAVYQSGEDSSIINIAKDLSFEFRGNNIDSFEFATPFHIKTVRNSIFVIAAIFLAFLFAIPTESSIRYDVIVNGITHENVTIRYNVYTQEYSLKGEGTSVKHIKHIDSISIPKQALLPRELIPVCIILAFYLIAFIVLYEWFKRGRRKRISQAFSYFFSLFSHY